MNNWFRNSLFHVWSAENIFLFISLKYPRQLSTNLQHYEGCFWYRFIGWNYLNWQMNITLSLPWHGHVIHKSIQSLANNPLIVWLYCRKINHQSEHYEPNFMFSIFFWLLFNNNQYYPHDKPVTIEWTTTVQFYELHNVPGLGL